MGKFSKLIIPSVAGLFLLSLTACQKTPHTISTKYQPSPYKHIIQVASNHKQLKKTVERLATKNKNLLITHEDDFSEFRIVLATQTLRINTLETKPLLMGRLQKTSTPVNFKTSYQLTNTSSHILTKGEASEITEISGSIYPKLQFSKNIDQKTLNEIAKRIVTDVQAHIKSTPWSTTVIGQKDERHITVFAGEDAGLIPGAIFVTESQPTAKLQVAMFEQTVTGQSRAILNLIEGFLPTVGRRLVPAQ